MCKHVCACVCTYVRTCDFILLNLPPLAHVTKTCEDDTKSLISLTKVHAVCVWGGGHFDVCVHVYVLRYILYFGLLMIYICISLQLLLFVQILKCLLINTGITRERLDKL